MRHPSGINQAIVDKVVARRGRLHAYEHIDPPKTALVVVDLDTATVERMKQDTDIAATMHNINALAGSLRSHGGTVAWVTTPIQRASDNFRAIYGEKLASAYEEEGRSGQAATVWHELDVHVGDIRATKHGASALFPGKSDLHEQLQKRGIDTVLTVGTVTNVCCESSARDAYELGYKVVMVSDALTGHAHGLHEGTLAVIFRNFGDVRPTKELLVLLGDSESTAV